MSDRSIYWGEVKEGQKLPTLVKEVTATTVIAGAIASRDFMPVHHDKDFAQKQGIPDIFFNILTTGGWVGKYLTDWSGPEAELKRVDIRLGMPCFPGNTLTWNGTVVKKYVENGEHLVDVEYEGNVPMGNHARGVVTMVLPTKR